MIFQPLLNACQHFPYSHAFLTVPNRISVAHFYPYMNFHHFMAKLTLFTPQVLCLLHNLSRYHRRQTDSPSAKFVGLKYRVSIQLYWDNLNEHIGLSVLFTTDGIKHLLTSLSCWKGSPSRQFLKAHH